MSGQKIIYLYPEGGSLTLSGDFPGYKVEAYHNLVLEDGEYRVAEEKQEGNTITYTLEKTK